MAFRLRSVRIMFAAMAMVVILAAFALSISLFGVHHVQARTTNSGGFNQPGNVLISDQFNNRVIEVNQYKHIVWSFGSNNPSLCNPGPGAVIAPNDAERLSEGLTLIPGTGAAAGTGGFKNACADNRVIVVNQAGQIVWQYGTVKNSPLNTPVFAIQLPNRDILIVDQGNNRVIEVGRFSKKIVWSYGPSSGPGALNAPNSAELLPNGHILIADENNNRVIEITRAGQIVWQTSASLGLNVVAFASRLPNGNTLIADSGNNRIIEVTPDQSIVFQYFTNKGANSNANPNPTGAVQLANGDFSIADQFNNRAIIIDSNTQIEFQYGMTNVIGNGQDQLYAPYSAVVIGDYTGQTPPPPTF